MTGGLYDPLGTDRDGPGRAGGERRGPRPSAPVVAAALLLAGLAALLAVSYLRDTGDRGMPLAVAPIDRPPPAAPLPTPAAPAPPALPAPPIAPAPLAASASADQDVQIENGVRVVRPRRDASTPASPPASAPAYAPVLPPVFSPVPPPAQGARAPRAPDGRAAR